MKHSPQWPTSAFLVDYMPRFKRFGMSTALAMIASGACAQVTTFSEQSVLIKAPNAVARIGADIFGDKVNLYQGSLEFAQTDVSLQGNNKLSVAVGRRIITGQQPYPSTSKLSFGGWQLDMPFLSGVFASADGWKVSGPSGNPVARCSDFSTPPSAFSSSEVWGAEEFWQGNFMHIPGQGDQQLLLRDTSYTKAPGPVSSYPVVTANQWSVSCLPFLENDATPGKTMGEGFLAISPDGVKYRFDHIVSYDRWSITKKSGSATALAAGPGAKSSGADDAALAPVNPFLPRKEVRLLPTTVTDRYGNWVKYTYDSARPENLISITSSDLRTLTLRYDRPATPYIVTSVTDGTRTWTYTYNASDRLDTVVLPDNMSWQLTNVYTLLAQPAVLATPSCDGSNVTNQTTSGSMVHPSGATGSFTLTNTSHGRSDVLRSCVAFHTGGNYALVPRYINTLSLTNKTISGPGMANMTWTYLYGPSNASWAPCGAGCAKSKTVSVTDPASLVTRYTFGNQFRVSEGRFEQADLDWNGSSAVSTTTTQYRASGAGPYPAIYGYGGEGMSDSDSLNRPMPVDQMITTQQGASFTWTASSFDDMARATSVSRSSSVGPTRTESTTYQDFLPVWVLGQLKDVTEASTGALMIANTYDAGTAALLTTRRFGVLEQTLGYNPDGTLASRKDGLNQMTSYSNYKAGLPQNTSYPTGASESAVVRSIGYIDSMTNAAGFTAGFGYDAAGRVNRITHPTGDPVAWNDTTILVEKVAAAERGIALPHVRQTVSTGNARTITYFDGLLRPIVTRTFDTAASATTRGVQRKFDHNSNTTFESYPQPDILDVTSAYNGTTMAYDVLNRPLTIIAASELGDLTTTNVYGSPFTLTSTNPRGNVSTMTLTAFDDPSSAAASSIALPLSVTVSISRDVFGKPTAVTRSGGGASATRSFVYDSNQRLCKTVEPETAATVQAYDAASNVIWRASGLTLPSTINCDTASGVAAASKITFGYDSLNRLKSTTYGDASPAITRTYTADGLLDTITSNASVWTYSYNNRRLNWRESLAYGGSTYNIDRAYTTNGAVGQLTYPDGTAVPYLPNALGEPTKVGTYASAVTYHPNGAIAGFTYGNGIVHTLQQNVRGLPEWSIDAGVLRDNYGYDQNGNVTAILDWQLGVSNLESTYDELDRLKSVYSAPQWGTANFSYDALDNLTNSYFPGGATARTATHNYASATNRLTGISSSTSAYNLSYGYDARGNITTRGGQGFVFDLGNRLKSATGKATYAYDGLGHRTSTVGTDGVNRVAVYTQGGQLLYRRATSVPLAAGTRYIYLGRNQVAEVKAAGAN